MSASSVHRSSLTTQRNPVHKPSTLAPLRARLVASASAEPPSESLSVVSLSPELSALSSCTLLSVPGGASLSAASLVAPTGLSFVFITTHTADFDSFEQASKLVDFLPTLDAAGVRVSLVVVGTPAAAAKFADFTNFPVARLYADPTAACHAALGYEPGAGRAGGEAPYMSGVPGMGKLMAMCAGIGSPGTLQEVFRGYLGDKSAPPVFRTGSNVDLPWKDAFNLVGRDHQRPFELATLRGMNMAKILSNWEALAPADGDLLVQRGGALLFEDGVVKWSHRDAGILGFVEPSVAVAAAGL
jgi:AhpC/TSA antioxidant enzyme